MIEILWQAALGLATLVGIYFFGVRAGKKNESNKRDLEDKQSDIDTMERINADNPYSSLPVDERLQRHTSRK